MLAALLFLLLPMTAASCEAGTGAEAGSIEIAFTGAGIVRDTPDVTTSGTLARTPEEERELGAGLHAMGPAARTAGAATVLVTVLGAQAWVLRGARRRRVTAAAAAALAAGLLVVTERLAAGRLEAEAREQLAGPLAGARDRTALLSRIHDAVQVGLGFWLVLGVLGLILASNAVLLIGAARRARAP